MIKRINSLFIVTISIILINLFIVLLILKGDNMNDITILEKKRDFTKSVTIYIMVKGGIFTENEANNGIGNLFSRVWVKSNKILESSEFYGGSIFAKITPYALEISLSIPTEFINDVLPDFIQFITSPLFQEDIFKREQKFHLEELNIALDNPNTQAYINYNKLAYDGSPYALPIDGTIDSVSSLTLQDVEQYYRDNMKSSNMVISIAGNYDDNLVKEITQMAQKLDKGNKFSYNCKNTQLLSDRRQSDIDTRIQQAKLFIGYDASPVNSKDYVALKVLTELLGGGMSSRYFLEIRKNSGYAYAVNATYPSRHCSSRFTVSIGLDYENIDSAIQKIDDINLNLKNTITDQEIEKAKNAIYGSTLMETQTNSSIAWNRAFFEVMGLGADYYETYLETLESVTKEQILEASEIFKGYKAIYILRPAE